MATPAYASATHTSTMQHHLHRLLNGKLQRFASQGTFSGLSKSVTNVPGHDIEGYDYIAVFNTYPGCGVTCTPFFIELNKIAHLMNTTKRHPFLIMTFPYGYGSDAGVIDYYWKNQVSWPWLPIQNLNHAIQGFGTDHGTGNNIVSTNCPGTRLYRIDGLHLELLWSKSVSTLKTHAPFWTWCQKSALAGVPQPFTPQW